MYDHKGIGRGRYGWQALGLGGGMIRWGITIYRQPPEDYPLSLARDPMLADWKVGSGGTSWLDKLVDRGEAQRLKTDGYPDLYSALAG